MSSNLMSKLIETNEINNYLDLLSKCNSKETIQLIKKQKIKWIKNNSNYSNLPLKCHINSIVNKNNIFKSKNLMFKIGMITISNKIDIGWVDKTNFYDIIPDIKNGEFHCWLEDKYGNIYDSVQELWLPIMNNCESNTYFENETKDNLKSNGLIYKSYKVYILLIETFFSKIINFYDF